MITFTPTDVDLSLAIRAHSGTSMTPERRGQSYVDGYMADMQAIVAHFAPFATDENQASLAADLEAYRVKYLALMNAYLYSHSAVMSAFIAGPSKFPTARNKKRVDWADGHRQRWYEWEKAARERLGKKYDPQQIAWAARVVRSDDPQAVEKLQEKLATLTQVQEVMKAANSVIRGKGSQEEKEQDLTALGLRPKQIAELFTPSWHGLGFPKFSLTNNGAEIRRTKERIESLEKEAARPAVEDDNYLPDVRMEENKDDMRLRLFFDGKPCEEVRKLLGANGFHWSKTVGAWQRLLNNNARFAARHMKPKLAELLAPAAAA